MASSGLLWWAGRTCTTSLWAIPAPDAVNEAAIRILREQPELIHCYTSAQGDAAARQRFADSLNRRFGGDYTADQFYITVGAAASLCCVFHGLTCPGDEFIVFAPISLSTRCLSREPGPKWC